MSDDGRMERDIEYLRALREGEEANRFRAGLRAARAPRKHGSGAVESLARDAGYSKRSLYEYAAVVSFQLRFAQAVDGSYLCARRANELHPMLTYTHYRSVVGLDFEEAVEELVHAETEGMTPDQFRFYLKGKAPAAAVMGTNDIDEPLFRWSGSWREIMAILGSNNYPWKTQQVRLEVWRVE